MVSKVRLGWSALQEKWFQEADEKAKSYSIFLYQHNWQLATGIIHRIVSTYLASLNISFNIKSFQNSSKHKHIQNQYWKRNTFELWRQVISDQNNIFILQIKCTTTVWIMTPFSHFRLQRFILKIHEGYLLNRIFCGIEAHCSVIKKSQNFTFAV